ncbi:hypothetical protein GCWU000246_00453 [Jonquetella anthropi E3_33 E1]|nr:hypothetical protein GCWU000246_00453 [Jonquetella anthropi E3_33 E1]
MDGQPIRAACRYGSSRKSGWSHFPLPALTPVQLSGGAAKIVPM